MFVNRRTRLQMLAPLAGMIIAGCAAFIALVTSPSPAQANEVAAAGASQAVSQAVSRTVTLKDIRIGLDKLKSYRARLAWSFDGKLANGKPYTNSYVITESVIPASKQGYRLMAASETPRAADDRPSWTIEMYEVSGMAYISGTLDGPESKCEPVPVLTGLFNTSELIGSATTSMPIRGVRLVKPGERVNGILADQYELDATTFLTRGVKSATGSIWVAREGGYVVKLAVQATGNLSMLGEEEQGASDDERSKPADGKFTLEYVVLDINKEKPIALPATCAPAEEAAGDIPLPKSATGVFTKEGTTIFQSEDKQEALVQFFSKELPANGWKAGKSQNISGMSQMTFTKGSRTLTVIIMPNPTGKGMMVAITESK